jgi:hypothetical protein
MEEVGQVNTSLPYSTSNLPTPVDAIAEWQSPRIVYLAKDAIYCENKGKLWKTLERQKEQRWQHTH